MSREAGGKLIVVYNLHEDTSLFKVWVKRYLDGQI